MKSFILLTFAFLGWGWYEMSGGAEFGATQQLAVADPNEVTRLPEVARADTIVDRLPTVTRPAPQAEVVLASADAQAAPNLGLTLASAARMPLARPSKAILAKAAAPQPAPVAAPDLWRVTGNVVNMRAGPGTDYNVVDQLRRDARVEVLSESDSGWVELRTVADNRIGWMSKSFVTIAAN